MKEKTPFEILDIMNQNDAKNGTRTVAMSPHFISLDKIKEGGKIVMGISSEAAQDLINETHMALVLIVDKNQYHKIKES